MSFSTILATREDRVGSITVVQSKAFNARDGEVINEVVTAAAGFEGFSPCWRTKFSAPPHVYEVGH